MGQKSLGLFNAVCHPVLFRTGEYGSNHEVSIINSVLLNLFRNSIFIFVLFHNNVNVNTNLQIAKNLGHEDDYLAAMAEFEEKGVNRHGYVVIRKDTYTPSTPACYSNMFNDLPQLGPNPVTFAPEILKKKKK